MKIITEANLWSTDPSNDWIAYDADTYDGAPDAGPRARRMGHGATPEEAIADLQEQLDDDEQ